MGAGCRKVGRVFCRKVMSKRLSLLYDLFAAMLVLTRDDADLFLCARDLLLDNRLSPGVSGGGNYGDVDAFVADDAVL